MPILHFKKDEYIDKLLTFRYSNVFKFLKLQIYKIWTVGLDFMLLKLLSSFWSTPFICRRTSSPKPQGFYPRSHRLWLCLTCWLSSYWGPVISGTDWTYFNCLNKYRFTYFYHLELIVNCLELWAILAELDSFYFLYDQLVISVTNIGCLRNFHSLAAKFAKITDFSLWLCDWKLSLVDVFIVG